MKRTLIYFILSVIIVSQSACGLVKLPSNEHIPDDCVKNKSCDGLFVENQTCTPPCWQGITPGISTYEETRQILGELEFLDPELLEDEFEGNQFGKRLTFHPPDWKWTGMAFFEGEKLAMLEFGGELYANFENVSESIAPPTSVIVLRDFRGGILFYVIEQSMGVLYVTGGATVKLHSTNRIDPDTPITGIRYFDPAQVEDLYRNRKLLVYHPEGDHWSDSIQPWLGYGTITDRYDISVIKDDY